MHMNATSPATNEMSFDFKGRTAVITGAGQGIGLEIARAFRGAGAQVIMFDRDADLVMRVAAELDAIGVAGDVTGADDVDALIRTAVERTGRLDVVVNNAGILRDKMVWKLTDEDWEAVLAVHLGGMFRVTRAAVPVFRQQSYGRVVNVTSYTGLRGNVGQSAYAAAKAGVVGFTKTAAKELARFGVTVNAISPNAETRMIAGVPKDKRAELAAAIPMGRFAEPREMAAAVMFLASVESGYITGVVLPVDGGLSM
jgi:3-oxoacyl-[acyl-carrier protein] reductase